MEPAFTILLADEDPAARAFLTDNLAADGFEVWPADARTEALALLAAHRPDLVICDLNGDTLGLLDALRTGSGLVGHADPQTSLIVLTSRADELQTLRALERGGDDVIAKPFSYRELLARVRAVLRRARRPAPEVLRVGHLEIDMAARQARVGGRLVALTATEYKLLVHLARDPGRVFTKTELLRDVWGSAPRAARGFSTRTPAGCATSWPRTASGSW